MVTEGAREVESVPVVLDEGQRVPDSVGEGDADAHTVADREGGAEAQPEGVGETLTEPVGLPLVR